MHVHISIRLQIRECGAVCRTNSHQWAILTRHDTRHQRVINESSMSHQWVINESSMSKWIMNESQHTMMSMSHIHESTHDDANEPYHHDAHELRHGTQTDTWQMNETWHTHDKLMRHDTSSLMRQETARKRDVKECACASAYHRKALQGTHVHTNTCLLDGAKSLRSSLCAHGRNFLSYIYTVWMFIS